MEERSSERDLGGERGWRREGGGERVEDTAMLPGEPGRPTPGAQQQVHGALDRTQALGNYHSREVVLDGWDEGLGAMCWMVGGGALCLCQEPPDRKSVV